MIPIVDSCPGLVRALAGDDLLFDRGPRVVRSLDALPRRADICETAGCHRGCETMHLLVKPSTLQMIHDRCVMGRTGQESVTERPMVALDWSDARTGTAGGPA